MFPKVKSSPDWTLAQGIRYLTGLAPVLKRIGCEGRIIGSVANKGESFHDLDILIEIIDPKQFYDNDGHYALVKVMEPLEWDDNESSSDDPQPVTVVLKDRRVVDLWFAEDTGEHI